MSMPFAAVEMLLNVAISNPLNGGQFTHTILSGQKFGVSCTSLSKVSLILFGLFCSRRSFLILGASLRRTKALLITWRITLPAATVWTNLRPKRRVVSVFSKLKIK